MQATHGRYFRREDYAGFWLRLGIDIIDLFVVGVLNIALAIVLWLTFPEGTNPIGVFLGSCVVVAFGYFVLLKRSKFSTVGYRIAGVRIVGLDGRPASLP